MTNPNVNHQVSKALVENNPEKNQRQTFNSYYLFTNSDYISLTAWVKTVKSDPHLKVLAGVGPNEKFPSLESYYNFVDRLAGDCPQSEHVAPKGKNNKRPKIRVRT